MLFKYLNDDIKDILSGLSFVSMHLSCDDVIHGVNVVTQGCFLHGILHMWLIEVVYEGC